MQTIKYNAKQIKPACTQGLKPLCVKEFALLLLSLLISGQVSSQELEPEDDFLLMTLPAIVASQKSSVDNSKSLCDGFAINDKRDRPMQAMSIPAPMQSYVDDVFGSQITRVSNSSALSSGIVRTLYSTIQAWNADESRMLLWHRGEGHYLYNGQTYELIERLDLAPSDIEQIFWSNDNPDLLYYPNQAIGRTVPTSQGSYRLKGKELMQYNIATKQFRLIKDLNSVCSSGDGITAGNDVQMISYDDDAFGLRCGSKGFRYRVSNDSVSVLAGSASFEAPQSFPSGERFFHQGRILNDSLVQLRELDLGKVNEHSSLGRLHNNNDAYYAVAFDANQRNSCGNGIGSVVVHDASDAICRVLVGPSNGYPYSLSGTHISALAAKRPGWAVVSSVGYGIEGDTLLEQELYLVNTDPATPQVCRIAHHRSAGRRGSIGYFAEPHPVISPSGTRVLFNSDWNNSGRVDVFVIELPNFVAK